YFFQEEKWIKKKVPLPNVIYDRLPNRKAENYKPIVRAKRNTLQLFRLPSLYVAHQKRIQMVVR
ncbi:hypothetical protein ACT453_15200, partial [Bacillus sp. D-CC]